MSQEMTMSALRGDPAREQTTVAKRRRSLLHQGVQWLCVGILAFASFSIVSHFVLESVTVSGWSMAPSLRDTDHYILNRWIYHVRAPERQEIVVIRDPETQGLAVKRVIAGAGDLVFLKQGAVYVNGRRIAEPYLPAGIRTFPAGQSGTKLFKCGPDQYFVLGDNRMNSVDSRTYGPVVRSSVLGMIIQ